MPAIGKSTLFLRGKVYWAKILGDPRPNFNKDAREWAFEFEPNAEGLALLKQHKLNDRIKDKDGVKGYEGRGKFIVLRKPEFNFEGKPNKHIRVYDSDDVDWDHEQLIGNGSGVDLKLDVRDYGPGKKKGMYPVAVRVNDLISYESSEFGALDREDNEDFAPAKKKAAKKDTFKEDFNLADDLDDEIPL